MKFLRDLITPFLYIFQEDFIESNRYILEAFSNLIPNLTKDYSVVVIIIAWITAVLLNHYIKNYKQSKISITLAIILFVINLSILVGPIYLPYKIMRFFFGGTIFSTFTIINTNIYNKLLRNNNTSNNNNTDNKTLLINTTKDSKIKTSAVNNNNMNENSFYFSFMEAMYFQSYEQLTTYTKPEFKYKRLLYMLCIALYADIIFYLMKEWTPMYVLPSYQSTFVSLIAGLYLQYGVSVMYSISLLISTLAGSSALPHTLQHRHPFLSCTLGEFWGTRWNPITMKVLQGGYYIPLMHMFGVRWVAMLGCFVGSALLHGYLTWIESWNVHDTWQMASFFLIHGLLTTAEQLVIHACGFKQYFYDYILVRAGQEETGARYQWLVEGLVSATLVVAVLSQMESTPPYWEGIKHQCAAAMVVVTVSSYMIHTYTTASRKHRTKPTSHLLLITSVKTVGWLWTVVALLAFVPRLIVPVLNANSDFSPRSYVIGPLIRTVYKMYGHNYDL